MMNWTAIGLGPVRGRECRARACPLRVWGVLAISNLLDPSAWSWKSRHGAGRFRERVGPFLFWSCRCAGGSAPPFGEPGFNSRSRIEAQAWAGLDELRAFAGHAIFRERLWLEAQ